MRRRWRLTLGLSFLIPLALPALVGTAAAGAAGASGAADVRVSALDLTFEPAMVTINVGDTVTWVVASTARGPHDVTADNGAFASPRNMQQGQTFTWTAPAPGTYTYLCTIHARANMRGTVVVRGAAGMPRAGGGGMAGPRAPGLALGLLSVGAGALAGLVVGGRRRRAERREAAAE